MTINYCYWKYNYKCYHTRHKLASNDKLTSDKHKKHFENNLCLYCGARDHKLNFCPKKQTTVTSKSHSTSATANTLVVASEKLLEK